MKSNTRRNPRADTRARCTASHCIPWQADSHPWMGYLGHRGFNSRSSAPIRNFASRSAAGLPEGRKSKSRSTGHSVRGPTASPSSAAWDRRHTSNMPSPSIPGRTPSTLLPAMSASPRERRWKPRGRPSHCAVPVPQSAAVSNAIPPVPPPYRLGRRSSSPNPGCVAKRATGPAAVTSSRRRVNRSEILNRCRPKESWTSAVHATGPRMGGKRRTTSPIRGTFGTSRLISSKASASAEAPVNCPASPVMRPTSPSAATIRPSIAPSAYAATPAAGSALGPRPPA